MEAWAARPDLGQGTESPLRDNPRKPNSTGRAGNRMVVNDNQAGENGFGSSRADSGRSDGMSTLSNDLRYDSNESAALTSNTLAV